MYLDIIQAFRVIGSEERGTIGVSNYGVGP